ncbi:MAG TPA: hypothetical protein VL172_02315 [Kofleriaceae bacterium]|nr:hypothetical protein [Kofleriaceae bacterium]
MDELRAYGICRSCFEPYLSRRGCPRCDGAERAGPAAAEAPAVLPVELELERQADLHRMVPRAAFAVVGAAVLVITLIAVAIQAA